jgi:hypothetical protein
VAPEIGIEYPPRCSSCHETDIPDAAIGGLVLLM